MDEARSSLLVPQILDKRRNVFLNVPTLKSRVSLFDVIKGKDTS